MNLQRLATRHLLTLLAVVAVLQLSAPASMILGREQVLRRGETFRFRTAPVDPYDAFRGRYVALRFEDETAGVEPGLNLRRGEKVFVVLDRDAGGFARLVSVSRKRPPSPGAPYLQLPVEHASAGEAHFDLPFDRYYLNERLAPEAERAYRESRGGDDGRESYVEVRVYRGRAVLEELYVDGRPVGEVVREAGSGR